MPIFGGHDARIDSLKQVPIFSNCSDKELRFIASEIDEVGVEAGEIIITEGHLNHTFHIILSGEAEVQVDGRTIKKLGAGDFFGEISMMDRGPATATVVATAPSRLGVMSHGQFRDAIRADDDLYNTVMTAIGQRLRDIGQQDRLTQ
jgi:CRP/FNR family transcriptional regulator, cyclic AMP receptor protein